VVIDEFMTRYVRKVDLRSADNIERAFDRHVRPSIGAIPIYELRRHDIVAMLDAIEDDGAPVMADSVLAYVRKCFNWQAARDDTFNSPVVRGMARTKPRERARTRILDDEEIRDIWRALDKLGDQTPACFPAFVKVLLLTAQRRSEVARMSWGEINGETWVIPPDRYKTKVENAVPLTAAVRALIGTARKGFVFSSDGGKHAFSGFSKSRAALNKQISDLRKRDGRGPMPSWVLHDLRRTARSLMSRSKVDSDHAERVLGHAIGGVRATYDRHTYLAEKRDALEKLAALVDRILQPTAEVVSFPKRRRK
jgi:integrase